MSGLDAPLMDAPPSRATTEGKPLGGSGGGGRRGPPPSLPRVPSRIRSHKDGGGAGPLRGGGARPETYSTQSEVPPDAKHIQNRVRYPASRTAQSYDTVRTGDELEPDMDDIFAGDSYHTVDFESESFDVPQRSRSHLNLMPAVKQFAVRNGYEVDDDDLELTFRAFFIGGIFALLNAAVNMFFAFRYAGGLAQYWVILVSYPIAKATEKLPRGLLNPGPFSPKEHTIIMTIAIAGSLAGTLGLAGGMLALDLFFETRLEPGVIFVWAIVAGFFGLFFGNTFYHMLVVPDHFEWPFSKVNAAFIAAFYRKTATAYVEEAAAAVREEVAASTGAASTDSSVVITEDEDGNSRKLRRKKEAAGSEGGGGDAVAASRKSALAAKRPQEKKKTAKGDLKVFFAFFAVAFCWFPVPNYFVPALFTMSMLCWAPHSWNPVQPFGRGGTADLTSVLSSGEAGAGMPGLGGWASVWSFGPSVIPLSTSVWIVVGIVLIYWVWVPLSFFSGLAAWPGSFREYDANGSFYNQSEGYYNETGEPVYLSGVGMAMYVGVSLAIVGMLTESVLGLIDYYREHGCHCCGRTCSCTQRRRIKIASTTSQASTAFTETGSTASTARNVRALKYRELLTKSPIDGRINIGAVAVFAVAAVLVVEFAFPKYQGQNGLGMPVGATVFCLVYAFVSAYGCGMIYATTGQQFSGGVCVLLQIIMGVLVPGSARANIISVMLCNTVVSQSMGILQDYKSALYLQVRARNMFIGQLFGAVIGVLVSATMFIYVLWLNDSGKITLGSAEWPAVGAVSQSLNAKIFGEQGPAALFHGTFLHFLIFCMCFAVVGPVVLWLIPEKHKWKKWLPNPVLLGVGGLYAGVNFTCISLLIIAVLYQAVIATRCKKWYAKHQYDSTAGVNAGVGLSGLVVMVLTTLQVATVAIGPQPEGNCTNVSLPAVTAEDVACWNLNTGCNTPWPSN